MCLKVGDWPATWPSNNRESNFRNHKLKEGQRVSDKPRLTVTTTCPSGNQTLQWTISHLFHNHVSQKFGVAKNTTLDTWTHAQND